jgi:CheY-like chemotaxis protein
VTGAPRVLYVEDNPDDVELARRALASSRIPHELVVASDGGEALDRLGSGAPLPDLVLLDLRMPRVDGFTVLRKIRRGEDTRQIPVVIFSSASEELEMALCYHEGANSYVQKPLDFREFARDVPLLLHYWARLNVPADGPRVGADEAADGLASPPAPRVPHPEACPIVLVVDPDPVTRQRSVDALLPVAGQAPVHAVASAAEAGPYLLKEGTCCGARPILCPRLVLLDLATEVGDGLGLLGVVRSHIDHRAPIVAFTRDAGPDDVAAFYRYGGSSFVRKPRDPRAFRDVVAAIGHYWTRINRLPPREVMPPWPKHPLG